MRGRVSEPILRRTPETGVILVSKGLYLCYCRQRGQILGIASPDGKLTSFNKAA